MATNPFIQTTTNQVPHSEQPNPSLTASEAAGSQDEATRQTVDEYTRKVEGADTSGSGFRTAQGEGFSPSSQVPGAFREEGTAAPKDHLDLAAAAGSIGASVQQTAQRAGETAAQYLPKSVVDTVSQYIPLAGGSTSIRASSHDIPHQKSLPTTELKGTRPGEHVGGVGSLPGNASEISVGKLPDERFPPEQQKRSVGSGLGTGMMESAGVAAAGVGAGVGAAYGAVKNIVPGTSTGGTSLPSSETQGVQLGENVGGAGPLPGRVGESNVAQLPGEKGADNLDYDTRRELKRQEIAGEGAGSAGGAGTLPSKTDAEKEGGYTAMVGGALAGAAAAAGGAYQYAKNTVVGAPSSTSESKPSIDPAVASLPTQEVSGAKPFEHTSGVGALPGGVGEAGVAKLPDEKGRSEEVGFKSGGPTDPNVGTRGRKLDAGAGDMPTWQGGIASVGMGEGGRTEMTSGTTGRVGATGGAGPLPGSQDEEGVAKLPDEKLAEKSVAAAAASASAVGAKGGLAERSVSQESGMKKDVGTAPAGKEKKERRASEGAAGAAAVGAGALGGGALAKEAKDKKQEDDSKKPKVEGQPAQVVAEGAKEEKKEEKKEQATKGKPNKGGAYDSGYHPAELHPRQEGSESQREPAPKKSDSGSPAGHEPPSEKAQESKISPSSTSSKGAGGKEEKHKKVGFMEKMKGEAKILLGKVEGKKGEAKVEEGKKILQGVRSGTA